MSDVRERLYVKPGHGVYPVEMFPLTRVLGLEF